MERMSGDKPRLRIEELAHGWEVLFHDRAGSLLHISHCETEIAALRAARFIVRHYNYDGPALLTTRRAQHRIDIDELMAAGPRSG